MTCFRKPICAAAALLICAAPNLFLRSASAATFPSAIGNESVSSIAVSPAFSSTGEAFVISQPATKCSTNCTHLWRTKDAGFSWSRLEPLGWEGGRLTVLSGPKGEQVFSAGKDHLQLSRDGGIHWSDIGSSGYPAAEPDFEHLETVAVAGISDYLLAHGRKRTIAGSGGQYHDQTFFFPPSFPSSGRFHDALLVGANDENVPFIQQCSKDLKCTGATPLTGATQFALPVSLYASSRFGTDGVVYAQAGRGIYKSTDGGLSFVQLVILSDNAMAQTTPAMAIAPGYSESGSNRKLYVSVFEVFQDAKTPRTNGGVFQSTDAGVTWAKLDPGSALDNGSTTVAVSPNGVLFAGYIGAGHAGLLCNDGHGWQTSCGTGKKPLATGTLRPKPTNQSGGPVAGQGSPSPGVGPRPTDKQSAPADSRTAQTLSLLGVALVGLVAAAIWLRRRVRLENRAG
jgi:photosystem II stability/assembly factor-like uncharacterized protein